MGFLTLVVIHNDALVCFEDNPKAFGEAILRGITEANYEGKQVSVPCGSYANYINVEPSRHADHEVLFLSKGNCVRAIGPYEKDWTDRVKNSPDYAKSRIKSAKILLNGAEEKVKQAGTTKKEQQ